MPSTSSNFSSAHRILAYPAARSGMYAATVTVIFTAFALFGLSHARSAAAAELPVELTQQISRFLIGQMSDSQNEVSVTLSLPSNTTLPPCTAPEPFLPPGGRLSGRFPVGVRCDAQAAGGVAWTRYIEAAVHVEGLYYVTTRPMNTGDVVAIHDIQATKGDLSSLPRGTITDPGKIIGKTVSYRVNASTPLRNDMLHAATVVHAGQTVKMIAQGAGFSVTSEGRALTNGVVGNVLQVKTAANQTMSGIVQSDGTVAMTN